MPVLLLAQGDTEAKTQLRKAIEARYGTRPPAFDTLQINFHGRAPIKVGPVKAAAPVDMTIYFRFPNAIRLDFSVKSLNVALQRGIESFDGASYRAARGGKTAELISNEGLIESIRRRMWAVAALLLTPLGDMYVRLEMGDSHQLLATNMQIGETAEIVLHNNHQLDCSSVECINPENGKRQRYTVRLRDGLKEVDGLLLPAKIAAYWEDALSFDVEPTSAHLNPTLDDSVFNLT